MRVSACVLMPLCVSVRVCLCQRVRARTYVSLRVRVCVRMCVGGVYVGVKLKGPFQRVNK